MTTHILSTKVFIPVRRSSVVHRPRLVDALTNGMYRKLTLITAPAGYGKTTLVSEWLTSSSQPVAWLSLEEADNDPLRFLSYFIASLQTIEKDFGKNLFSILQSSQPPPIESLITFLINEITAMSYPFILVLDDYHVINSNVIDNAISILLERIPPQLHLVIITREEPSLPLARLRVRNQLTEVRAKDLRFSPSEVDEFFERVMELNLTSENIALLASRTEGWVAGLQLAAISMKGHEPDSFIQSFTGNNQYIVEYLIDEVLHIQSPDIQTFLLRTSILDRFCGSLCDAVMYDENEGNCYSPASSQEILEYLDRSNLFIIPLDNEKRWYRYHHLFAELLRNRLNSKQAGDVDSISDLYLRASIWFEKQGLDIEAFHYAATSKDITRAAHLSEGKGMPLIFRGAVTPVLNWLDSLASKELDNRPALWVMYASALLMTGQLSEVEPKLQEAENAIKSMALDDHLKDLLGHIAAIRATLAVNSHRADIIIAESIRALEYLHPDNLPVRTSTIWSMGYAYQLQGDRMAAGKSYSEALTISQKIGHIIINVLSTFGLGNVHELENHLYMAEQKYQEAIKLAIGSLPLIACEGHLGLARIYFEWNDVDASKLHVQQSIQIAKQFGNMERVIAGEVFLARIMLEIGELNSTTSTLDQMEHLCLLHNLEHLIPKIAVVQADLLLLQGNCSAAKQLAIKHGLRLYEARILFMQGDKQAAHLVLEQLREYVEDKGLKDESLKVIILQSIVMHANGEKLKAFQLVLEALTIAETGGFVRTFLQEGIPMLNLLREVVHNYGSSVYLNKLLLTFEEQKQNRGSESALHLEQSTKNLIEPLSERELEVLNLIARGFSNQEISKRLFIALPTVKGHNRTIFDKLQVKRRTEAVARARELGILK